MTSNDDKTLRVEFYTDVNNVYPLSIYTVDNKNGHTDLHVRRDEIDSLMACLLLPMSPGIRIVTITGDYDVKWWNYHEVAFINYGTHKATVFSWQEAKELVALVRHEISIASSVIEPNSLAGANRRRDENLNSVFG